MLDTVTPVVATLFIWWFSTGAILYLDGLPRRTFKWSMSAATLIGVAALLGIWITANDTTPTSAYIACACAIAVWGWNEMGFLMGHVTGSRRTPCPEGAKGFQRFVYASQSIIYHELLIVLSGAAIAWATWGGTNLFALWTFLILWGMRLSTKLNIFLGVPNITINFLPDHLDYLKSYFAHKAMNLLFPLSVSISTVITVLLIQAAGAAGAGSHAAIGFSLLATLMALAVIEHWFLVIPLPFGDMWSWGLKSRQHTAPQTVQVSEAISHEAIHFAGTTPASALVSTVAAQTVLPQTIPSNSNLSSSDPARGWSEGISCAGVSR